MPIIIEELLIKAKVAESENSNQNKKGNGTQAVIDKTALEPVEKAVKEIMEILKRKNER